MGLPKGDLWVIKIDKDTFLAAYKPLPAGVKRGSWKSPPNTPLGYDMFIDTDFFPELTQYDDPIPVEIVEAEEETGLYIACYNDFFGNEQHLYNVKPVFNEDGTRLDRRKMQEVSQKRMMQDVPKADVVITNPTHFAVAIKYDKDVADAPIIWFIASDMALR